MDAEREHLIARARALHALPPPVERRAIRERAGSSQADFAAVLGVTQAAFALWEKGETTPSGQRAEAYASLLHDVSIAMAS